MTKKELYRKMKKMSLLASKMWALDAEISKELEETYGFSDCDLYDSGGIDMAELESGSDVAKELMDRLFGEGKW